MRNLTRATLLSAAVAGVGLMTATAHAAAITFDYTGAIQTYEIPQTGTYLLTGFGAQGGGNISNSATFYYAGGLGASVSGDVFLASGTTLQIVSAGQGSTNNDGTSGGGGGGGGSFVYISGQTQPLLVAGGGGGAAPFTNGGDARAGTSGGNSFNTTPGGTDGSGGYAGGPSAGGAGWFSNGGSAFGGGGAVGGFGPPTFAGGTGNSGMNGGFGGGGGGNDPGGFGAGGGGGYSGGGGGSGAGGGGSYLGVDFTNDFLLGGVNSGNGYVTIEAVPEPASLALLAGMGALALRRRRREKALSSFRSPLTV